MMAPLSFLLHLALSLSAPAGDTAKSTSFPSFSAETKESPRRPSRFPPPPWSFVASRIRYQFQLVRRSAAERTVPSPATGAAGVSLLSVAGWTLGGLFAVEYASSPVGPYREVAVLSGLVAARGGLPWPIGAWASRIYVDSEDAAEAGREIWGLPASVVPIDFDGPPRPLASSDGVGGGLGDRIDDDGGAVAGPGFVLSDGAVSLGGWSSPAAIHGDGGDSGGVISNLLGALDVTLPSYSGRLGPSDPLLRYPLTVLGPERISIGPAGTVTCVGEDEDCGLPSVTEDGVPLFTVDMGRVRLVAGVPDTIMRR